MGSSSVIAAWLVHAYTASGAVWALLAAIAVSTGALRQAFLWLFVAVVVDSTDGWLARRARVTARLPGFSGAKLDDIVDYLSYVFVPAMIMWRAELVAPILAFPIAAAMLLSSAYGFVVEDAKTTDHFFTGFPSYWNVATFYHVVFALPPNVNAAILTGLIALVFVRTAYVYPTRTRTLRPATLALGTLWSVAVLALVLQLPDPSRQLAWWSLLFPAYYFALSLALQVDRQTHHGR